MKKLAPDQLTAPATKLIYGCMGLGGSWNRNPLTNQERSMGFAALDAAVECGFSMYDNADIYCHGKSETVFGEYLQSNPGLRERIFVQSKVGIRFAQDGEKNSPHRFDFSYDHIISSVENIIKRMQCGYLDVLLLHRPDPLVEPGEVAKAFDNLESRGLVKYFGVSNHTPLQIDVLNTYLNQELVINQLELSLGHRGLIEAGFLVNQDTPQIHHRDAGLLDYSRLKGISVQAWSPLYKGRYTGAINSLDETGTATKNLITELAESKKCSPEAVVLGWLLRMPADIVPVIGSTNPERIRACAQADSIELTRNEWYSLMEAARGVDVP